MNEESCRQPPLWAALSSYLVGWLWFSCFISGFTGKVHIWFPLLFSVIFFLWSSTILREKAANQEHWFWMICSLMIAAALALNRGKAADTWAYLALHGFAAYWVLCRSGLLTEGESSSFLPWDLTEAALLLPFGGFFQRIIMFVRAIRQGIAKLSIDSMRGKRKSILVSCCIILAALPLFLLASQLLGQADRSFQHLLNRLAGFFSPGWHCPRWILDFIPRFLFGLPVGAYLFGLTASGFCRERPRLNPADTKSKLTVLRIAPTAVLSGILIGFLCLYGLFFSFQAGHLLGAFYGNVPGKLTAAEYAREGFFQLCKVMIINFILLAVAAGISQIPVRENKSLRNLSAALMIESIFLAVTAASKLILYIHRFGFTPLRLLSAWAVLVLTVGCILTLIRLHRPCRTMRIWILFTAASFTLLCFY